MTAVPDDARPPIDVLRSVGGDDMVAMLMRTFVQFAEERVGKLVEEAGNARWEEVASIAHAIKSSARQLGAVALGDACNDTETAGRVGNAVACQAGVEAIRREFQAARAWMSELATPAAS
jgi:HPt (histidine-containing phosphotransfer) domain-containing protein